MSRHEASGKWVRKGDLKIAQATVDSRRLGNATVAPTSAAALTYGK